MTLREELTAAVERAMRAIGLPADCQALLTPATKAGFGDYQANGAMGAAKRAGTNPRELAQRIVAALDIGDMAERIEVAGPGFINIHLSRGFLAGRLGAVAADTRLGIPPAAQSQTVVVDYSAPNLAKEMHVGHLRSTVIGDAVVRALEFRGDRVIRQNHVGDWGTQFGMLIALLEERGATGESVGRTALADIEAFYREAKGRFDTDPAFADRSRDYVVKLQAGDAHCLSLWQRFIEMSAAHSEEIYQKLNVTLTHADLKGESTYNNDLNTVIAELRHTGLLQESDGANVVFLEELRDREGNPQAVIVQKADGGFLYATTDLAAARHRAKNLHADRILYFIDDRQKLHMQQIFAISRRAGFVPHTTTLEHHPFGKMLGEDGKPFKTRAGGTVKLAELLDEAVERAARLIEERNDGLSAEERAEVARMVGIGAVKYSDLSKARTSDYVFSWTQMLSFEGNTAPYIQYACTRVSSLLKRAGVATIAPTQSAIALDAAEERALALKLLQFGEALEAVTADAWPHLLCAYLYELAGLLMRFYEACPVLKEDVPAELRESRLALAAVTGRTLRQGLDLLGIEVPERM